MTQFVLVKTNNYCSSLKPVEESQDDFLSGVAGRLFSNLDKIYFLSCDGKNIDSLMLDAQKAVIEASEFERTKLYHAIGEVGKIADELVFWYGSDYDKLECAYDISDLLKKLEESVRDSACELYIHYKKVK